MHLGRLNEGCKYIIGEIKLHATTGERDLAVVLEHEL